uniref:Uncharacterized protein n=1 Tax=Pan paniscus TaxID=9597 RepID=A0A2R8ZFR2_PANPA
MGTQFRRSYSRVSKTSRLRQGSVHCCVSVGGIRRQTAADNQRLKSLPGAERPGEKCASPLGLRDSCLLGVASWRWLKSQSSLQAPGHHPPDVGAFPPIPAGRLNLGDIGKLRLVF